ncbi:tubulointerstitial nephritis antigen-like [Plakobranchus ocellatus]|uniref:Tubulointerstitial nephritis antigen-like n=1 Tax=Plakobranchus ocellatus TaxID=259542 RepID=A0AAV4DB93_9GAST|nr:tubulointerstitial nephritis antigen-like [Plakobranchus ocellatus]
MWCLKKSSVFPITLLLLVGCPQLSFALDWGDDLIGPWCAKRPPGQDCCIGRDDYCAVPIFTTMCYCDIFCNSTANDCCPDYLPHCLGLLRTTTPTPTTLPPPRTTRAVGEFRSSF